MKRDSFLRGAAILGIAGILVKILGAFYRIPLANIIKSEGMGYYQTAYPIYVLLLTISTSGFPVAIAKMVSGRRALGNYKGAYDVFKIALIGLVASGILSSLFIFINANRILTALGNTNAYYALIAMVPAMFFVPIMAAFRGFFQGRQDMIPTATSQIFEQLFRVVFGLLATSIFISYGNSVAAGGASLGGSIGAFAGTLIMLYFYISRRASIGEEIQGQSEYNKETNKDIIKEMLKIAIPITLGATLVPLMDTIDTSLVLNRLQGIGYSEVQANDMYGQLKGFAQTLVNFPQVLTVAISISMVPAVSGLYARKRFKELRNTISSGLRITTLIVLPCAFGLFVLARPIINLLYYRNSYETISQTGEILRTLAFSIVFLGLVQTLTSILQGVDRATVPLKNLAIGAIIKIILTYSLTGIETINIKGAALSTLITYGIVASLNLVSCIRYTKYKIDFNNIFLKPLLASVLMAIVTYFSYNFLLGFIGDRLTTVLSIGIGALVYLLILILTKTITREDIKYFKN